MPQNTAISVIVPIYNVEKYLKECLESVRVQTFKDFNVIMIDDGSDDNSGKIAVEFAETDSRFIYKKSEHSGVAAARNAGLAFANGEYIAFIDSDDTVEPTYLEELYNAAVNNGCQISSCNYSVIRTDNGTEKVRPVKIRKLKTGVYTREYYVRHVIRDWDVRSYLWNKLWHRSLFFNNNITFPSMYFEDIATVARLAFHSNKVAIIDKPLYNYYIRVNSIMTSVKVEKINDYILAYGIVRNYIQNHGQFIKYRIAFLRFAFIIYFANYYNVFVLHLYCKNFHGWLKNQHISNKNILHFAKLSYKAVEGYPKLPHYILNPWDS